MPNHTPVHKGFSRLLFWLGMFGLLVFPVFHFFQEPAEYTEQIGKAAYDAITLLILVALVIASVAADLISRR